MKIFLIFTLFFSHNFSQSHDKEILRKIAHYEPYEGPPGDRDLDLEQKRTGFKMSELFYPQKATADRNYEGYRPIEFSGYTLIEIHDTPNTHEENSPETIQHIQKILKAAEVAYLDAHRDKAVLPNEMLNAVSTGPDRFQDNRSTFVFILKGSAKEIVEKLLSSEDFPSSLFRASLRLSRVSFTSPQLPFAMNLEKNPSSLSDTLITNQLKEGPYKAHSWFSSPNYPFTRLESWDWDIAIKDNIAITGSNEVKGFMIKPETEAGYKSIDWMPFLAQYLDATAKAGVSGYILDKLTGDVLLDGDPRIKEWNRLHKENHSHMNGFFGKDFRAHSRFGHTFVSDYYAEVILPTKDYEAYLSTGRSSGLLKMYQGMGFEIETSSTATHSKYPHLSIVVLKISHERWSHAVSSTQMRPGMKNLFNTIPFYRSFFQISKELKKNYRRQAGLRCIDIF